MVEQTEENKRADLSPVCSGPDETCTDILGTDHDMEADERQRQSEKVVNLGLAANLVLAAVKIFTGIVSHSQALLSDGINSTSDVVYFLVVRILVAFSGKPSDEEHPYGHRQFESIAALVVGAFVMTTGIAIFWESINSAFNLLTGNPENSPIGIIAVFVAAGTIIIKGFLMVHAKAVSRKINSIAVSSLAQDHRNDILASSGAAFGIVFGILGFRVCDPIAGAFVAVIVVKTGIDILRESASDLMDSVPGRELDQQVRGILSRIPEVRSVDEVHAHRFGPYYVLNITLGIEGDLSVRKGDEIAHRAEGELRSGIDMMRKVYIHYHPSRIE